MPLYILATSVYYCYIVVTSNVIERECQFSTHTSAILCVFANVYLIFGSVNLSCVCECVECTSSSTFSLYILLMRISQLIEINAEQASEKLFAPITGNDGGKKSSTMLSRLFFHSLV